METIGKMAARRGSGTNERFDGVKCGIIEVTPGGSLRVSEYGRMFCEQASRRFSLKYRDYEETVARGHKRRTVKSMLSTMQALVPKKIQNCVSVTTFNGTKLTEDELK